MLEVLLLVQNQYQYLYSDGDTAHLLNMQTYEELTMDINTLEGSKDKLPYLEVNMEVTVQSLEPEPGPLSWRLPTRHTYKVKSLMDRIAKDRGTTYVTGTLENGIQAQIPNFIKPGENLVIDLIIDFSINPDADDSVVVPDHSQTLNDQGTRISADIGDLLSGSKADAVLCVAGGWQGGNAASSSFLSNAELSLKQSVNTSLIAAHIAAHHLKPSGLLALTGAVPAQQGGTPGMIGYGMAKAAVHHLVASLAMDGSGIPSPRIVGILPQTLDTPGNRSAMPKADFSSWTPLDTVAELLYNWASDCYACENGHLYTLITKNSVTSVE
ncbi:hypothetical protein GGH16_005246 [Coemansia sp. RSA 560]|nr:hypothetical protein GGH16_005246 [Coemansia sp. RSA 560]